MSGAPGGRAEGPSCSAEPGCITCGDVAVWLTVVGVDGCDATCRDEQAREELVATELVAPVAPGDRVLVHAGVALERLAGSGTTDPAAPAAAAGG